MNPFSIEIVPTKNEKILKFVANQFIVSHESYEFKNIDEAKPSPLAQQLFYLPFVKTVYIAQNFIAIERYDIVTWEDVQEEVAHSIKDYLNSGKNVILENEQKKKIPVTVYAESTPNPGVRKFVANKPLVEGSFEFKNIEEAKEAPFVSALFKFSFVKEVFISANYVSIAKYDIVDWEEITQELRSFIKSYIEEGNPIVNAQFISAQSEKAKEEIAKTSSEDRAYSSIESEIISILNEYVQPAVASDGGHIAFKSYDEPTKTVKVILQGACSGCPSSTVTLKNGIETMLKDMLKGKVETVEAING